jgi:nucleoside-diphosphate-sugar epimerase
MYILSSLPFKSAAQKLALPRSTLYERRPSQAPQNASLQAIGGYHSRTRMFQPTRPPDPRLLNPSFRSDQTAQHAAHAAVLDELRTTTLEWTSVHIGYIADYFGIPHIRSHMSPLTINIDMANKAAAIPGTGNDLVSFTYSFDVARFVEAALDLPHWEQELFCYGDKRTLNEVVRIAEEETGT